MNCTVRIYWKRNNRHTESTMPQSMVATYLSRLPMEDIKAYTVELEGEPAFAAPAVPFPAGTVVTAVSTVHDGRTGTVVGVDPKRPQCRVVAWDSFAFSTINVEHLRVAVDTVP